MYDNSHTRTLPGHIRVVSVTEQNRPTSTVRRVHYRVSVRSENHVGR